MTGKVLEVIIQEISRNKPITEKSRNTTELLNGGKCPVNLLCNYMILRGNCKTTEISWGFLRVHGMTKFVT